MQDVCQKQKTEIKSDKLTGARHGTIDKSFFFMFRNV